METTLTLLIVVVVLTLIFDFINGFHDTANAIATVVSTRALKPLTSLKSQRTSMSHWPSVVPPLTKN